MSPHEPLERVGINVGLWSGDPDVDAVTRLSLHPEARGLTSPALSTFLGPDVWTPINTQNTAIARALLPAYYYIRMGARVGGHTIDRYGDILSGYFVAKCAKAMGLGVRVGGPVTAHVRSPHDLFKDLHHELAGMVIVEGLLPWLTDLKLRGETAVELYQALIGELREQAPRFRGFVWDDGGREFVLSMCSDMQAWLDVVRRIQGE